MDSWSKHLQRPETPAERRLYRHLLEQAKTNYPGEAIHLFRQLFIEGKDYPFPSIQRDLEWILNSGFIDHEFKFILNRSCYIYINSWIATGSQRVFIPELIEIFETLPTSTPYTFVEQQLRRLLSEFLKTPQYKALRCLALTIKSSWNSVEHSASEKPLETIINRYPYVYEYNLLTRDSSLEQRRIIRSMRQEAQLQFDINLSRYSASLKLYGESVKRIKTIQNPTLLSSKQLHNALHQFAGKVDGSNTQRDLAHRFLKYSRWTSSYREFKSELYAYLTSAIHSQFGRQHFNQRLASFLQKTLERYDDAALSTSLIEETCKKLLNFLIVESPHYPEHTNLIDLVGNLGATFTITLLLKIILLCQQAKSWLERRFSILFNHYASRPRHDVLWLVETLENTNVALSTNFNSNYNVLRLA